MSFARSPAVVPLLAIGLGIVGAACGTTHSAQRQEARETARAHAAEAPSNILRRDYVGSARCQSCHAKEYEAWARSPMHRMTRDAATADVKAHFDGDERSTLRFKADVIRLETHDGARFVRISRQGGADEVYRVTRVIGGRQREDFAGVRVASTRDPAAQSHEVVLPVSYLIFADGLRYKGYSVLVHERSSAQVGPVWGETCVFCHNTVPFFTTVLGAMAGPRAPHYQGEVVDALLPEGRRWRWEPGSAPALRDAIQEEATHLEGANGAAQASSPDSRAALRDLIGLTRARFTANDFVEVGIGCESCHNGAREHVADPSRLPSYVPASAAVSVTTTGAHDAASARAQAIDRVCARCHQVLFSRYPWTWEGERRSSLARGGSTINSGEGRDFLLGGCASALACTACHDPHDARDRAAKNDALATPQGNATCTKCHAALATEAAVKAHTHHDPRGAGGACVACHMPRKNMGLDTKLTRYHRIGSPTDPERVMRDRPLECALCHPKASTESLLGTMESRWNKAYPREEMKRLYPDLAIPTLRATLMNGKPHEQATAAAVLGEAHDRSAAPLIARQLVNEYPLVRAFAARALDDALQTTCAVDVTADATAIERDARRCLARFGIHDAAWPAARTLSPARGAAAPGDSEVPED